MPMRAIGALLLLAAALKLHGLTIAREAQPGFFSEPWVLTVIVGWEIFLGLWLVCGLSRPLAWRAAAATLCAFAGASFYHGLAGLTSCGCFGPLGVSPWFALGLNLVVVVVLLAGRPSGALGQAAGRYRLAYSAFGIFLLAGLAGAKLARERVLTDLTVDGDFRGNGSVVVLEPKRWLGHRLPLLRHIDIGSQLGRGQWIVLLYHHDCPECKELIATLSLRASTRIGPVDRLSFALIEVPPYGSDHEVSGSTKPDWWHGRLSAEKNWFVRTPVFLRIVNGKLDSATDQMDEHPI